MAQMLFSLGRSGKNAVLLKRKCEKTASGDKI